MALTCKLNQNLLRTSSCGYSLPSIVMVYLMNYDDVTATALASDSGGCETLTAITLASGASVYQVEPAKDSASFSDELVVADNGTKSRTHSLTFTVTGAYDGCKHVAFDDLSLGKFIAVVKTAEGSYLALGRTTGVEAETAVLNGGSDTNGMEITLSANVAESVVPLSDEAIATITSNLAE